VILDLFRFTNVIDGTDLVGAKAVNGYESCAWTERYRDAGEVEIVAPLSSGILTELPRGSFVSHRETFEVMRINDHYISEDDDGNATLKVTGKSFETILGDRCVGTNINWTAGYATIAEYLLAAAFTWEQAAVLINNHIRDVLSLNTAEVFPNVVAVADVSATGESVERVIELGNLYEKVLELLAMEDLGIRVVRKHDMPSKFTGASLETQLLIHIGEDVSNRVMFSVDTQDIVRPEYFWSDQEEYTTALVLGQFLRVLVEQDSPAAAGANRKVVTVDGSDIDRTYTTGMGAPAIAAIVAKMQTRGRQFLASAKPIALASVEISEASKYKYRVDYDIGDIVNVLGSYGENLQMRVVEHTTVEDENGQVEYPTLALY
jgi:hypothetical protein